MRSSTHSTSSGERFQFEPAQDRSVDLGKIVHLTAEGQPIGGRFYTLGHRNVLGLAFAPDGRLWATEMGPRGGDELNLIEQGKNYGWPLASYGTHYDGRDIPDDHKSRGFAEPNRWGTGGLEEAAVRPELVVEVRYDKVQGSRFRHGTRLLRFREDKDPADCTWRELRPPRKPDDPTFESLLAAS